MAINVSFNGATIFKPGAYSRTNIDLSGGFPLGQTGLVAIFGESTRGKPGSAEADIANNVFTADQSAEVREKYGTGAIVDAMNFLLAPASDGNIPSGAQAIYIYKTNASTQASITLASSEVVEVNEYGIGGNTVTLSIDNVGASATITVKQTRDLLEENDTVGGNIVMSADYTGTATVGTVTVTATQVILDEDAVLTTFDKAAYSTMLQLVSAIDLRADWAVSLNSTLYNSLSPDVLDQDAAVDAKGATAEIKKDAAEVKAFFESSSIVSLSGALTTGLPVSLVETALTGGALGASTTADITNALAALEEIRVNSVVPLFSRDATADISDNLTDTQSAYTILGIHQGVKTHCSLMSTTKNRSERQGYVSLKDTFVNCLDRASLLADPRLQICIQDTRNIDSIGNIKWFQPWSQSAQIAGARAGSPIGTPLTFKFFNTTGVRHTAQPMSTAEEDIVTDFNPNSQAQQAIVGGISFWEVPQSGGVRMVVDNTTYQKDSNWVFNRGNVMYAADVLAFDFRNQLENIFVGQKNNIQASEIRSVAASILDTFLAQGITVSTSEAPNGYKKLDVIIEGNIVRINAIVVLVEGIDFILNDITITRVQSEA